MKVQLAWKWEKDQPQPALDQPLFDRLRTEAQNNVRLHHRLDRGTPVHVSTLKSEKDKDGCTIVRGTAEFKK